jgi:hypothetical protein
MPTNTKNTKHPQNKKIPDLVFAASRIAGEVLVQFISEDEKLQKKIEAMLGGAKRASKSQLWTSAQQAASLIQKLTGVMDFMVTDEAAAAMGGGNGHAHSPGGFAPKGYSAYAILNCAEGAPIEVVEAAFKALARKYHPDVPGTGDLEKMKIINAAYEAIKKSSV